MNEFNIFDYILSGIVALCIVFLIAEAAWLEFIDTLGKKNGKHWN